MARGKGFDHKKKGHPGDFPKGTLVGKNAPREAQEDEELLVVQEAFNNRIEVEEEI
ncbi:hypothetical protein M3182_07185 [Mesobacillus maritimus]|uniref:hypothetical protein n=1 Tax=Mesobacillus maritimus TaxID=1643336 RepID=UPI00203D9BA6|nr:hypothetical protein [Mesobacillus maritimus]MCM3585530.1 hypothetical protein [Mesobacillus maritimus]